MTTVYEQRSQDTASTLHDVLAIAPIINNDADCIEFLHLRVRHMLNELCLLNDNLFKLVLVPVAKHRRLLFLVHFEDFAIEFLP